MGHAIVIYCIATSYHIDIKGADTICEMKLLIRDVRSLLSD